MTLILACMAARTRNLVLEHLEDVHADIFEEYALSITQLVNKRNGIYALYRNGKLYYVGLAKNLRSRLKTNLRDRHSGAWDRFSAYLTSDEQHHRELESLLLRVVRPEGNRVRGKLRGSTDRKRDLERLISAHQVDLRNGLLGRKQRNVPPDIKAPMKRAPKATGTRRLRAYYKKQIYSAIQKANGTITFNGETYSSLSAAGVAITKRSTNGRHFWRVRDSEGQWVRLTKLE